MSAAVPGPYDAAVSTTALHWLGLEQLVHLYQALGGSAPARRGVPRRRPARLRPRSARHRGGGAAGPAGVAGCAGGCRGLRRLVGGRGSGSCPRQRWSNVSSGGRTTLTRTRPTATSSTARRSSPPASSRWARSGSTSRTGFWSPSAETASARWRLAHGGQDLRTRRARADRVAPRSGPRQCGQDLSVAREEFDLHLNSGRLHARRHGPADAPLVLAIPGLSANLMSFEFLAERLDPGIQLVSARSARSGQERCDSARHLRMGQPCRRRPRRSPIALGAETVLADRPLDGRRRCDGDRAQAAGRARPRGARRPVRRARPVDTRAPIGAVDRPPRRWCSPSAEAYLDAGHAASGSSQPWNDLLGAATSAYELEPVERAASQRAPAAAAVMEDAMFGSRRLRVRRRRGCLRAVAVADHAGARCCARPARWCRARGSSSAQRDRERFPEMVPARQRSRDRRESLHHRDQRRRRRAPSRGSSAPGTDPGHAATVARTLADAQ